jgi:ribonuclease P protein component
VKRRFRLTRSTDIQRVRRIGKSYAHPLIVFVVSPNELSQVRIGIVAGRTVGTAVQRNLAKRRLRACLDHWLSCLTGGYDILVLARKPISQADYTEICAATQQLMKRAGLFYERT